MIFRKCGGWSKAVWNFSENSSVLEGGGFPNSSFNNAFLTNDTNSVAFFTPGPRPQYMCSDWLIAVAPALPTKRGEHTKVDRKLIPAEILEQSNRQCHDKQEDEDCSQTRAKTRRMQFYNIKFRFMNSRWILYQKCASLPWSPLCRYLQLKTL